MTAYLRQPAVGDVMALEPIVVRSDAPLIDAARLMDEHRVSGLPVVDRSGALVGVITHADLLRARAIEYLWANWRGLLVRHLMTTPAVIVHRSTPISLAALRMERHGIHRLVVVADEDETLPIGIVSATDLVHLMADRPVTANAAESEAPASPS